MNPYRSKYDRRKQFVYRTLERDWFHQYRNLLLKPARHMSQKELTRLGIMRFQANAFEGSFGKRKTIIEKTFAIAAKHIARNSAVYRHLLKTYDRQLQGFKHVH